MNVIVKSGQTLLDVSIQHLGAESGVAALAQANGLDMTAEVTPGQVLTLPAVVDKRVVRVFRDGGYVPATNLTGELEGIDYWAIGYDFIIS